MSKIKKLLCNISQKYSNFILKHKFLYIFPKNICLLILSVILSFFMVNSIKNNTTVIHKLNSPNGFVDEIYEKPIKEKINISKIKKIDKFGLYFATYARINDSKYSLKILENNKVVKNIDFNPKKFKDNSIKYFDINIKLNKNSSYSFEIVPNNVKEGSGITLIKDGKKVAYEILNKSEFYNFVIIFSIIFLMIYFLVNYLFNSEKIKTEKSFMILMLIYLISILFIIPPYEIPDETYHFTRTYKTSQFSFNKDLNYNMKKKKISVPSNIKCLNYSLKNGENVISKSDIKNCLNSEKNTKKNLKDFRGTSKILVALPGAIGIKIVDLFSNSPLLLFYSGRLFSFFTSFLILLYAIKIIPKHKKILLFVCLMPMFVQQLVSYSYDSVLNALCILQIAYFIKFYYQKEKISNKDLIIYTLSSLLIMTIKLPYLLISASILFLDKSKFGENKFDKLKKILCIFGIIFISYYLSKFIQNIGYIEVKSKVSKINRGNSLIELIKNPKLILWIIYNTLSTYGLEYLKEIVGVFGWLKYRINNIIVIASYIMIILIILSEESKISKKTRLLNIFSMIILIGGIFLVMYLQWTQTGNLTIDGVQGRYLLPILPMIMIMLIPKNRKINLDEKNIYSFINISMLIFMITILVSYY